MKNKMRSIKQGNIAKRLLALIMDATVFGFVWGCLVAWVTTPIANKAMNYTNNHVKASRYEGFSKLYLIKENTVAGEENIIEPNEFSKIESDSQISIVPLYDSKETDVEYYRSRIKYYYCNFLTNNNIEYDTSLTDLSVKETYYSPDYNKEITLENGEKVLPINYYTDAWFDENFGPSKYSTLKEIKNATYDTVAHLYNSEFFTKINNEIKAAQAVIVFPPYVLSFFTFFFIIPVCFKNGETLGKKVAHLGFVTKEGFNVKKRQIIFRQLLLFLYVSFFLFVIGIGLTSFATLGLGGFVYWIATAISKTKRSPIDYAAYTYLIDSNKSVWFKDAEEETKKEAEFEEKMDKYRNKKVENKNLIQVGTEIVDEQIKKELEEENLKAKNE